MPYPNEHACRLNPPGKYTRFARKNVANGKDIIVGFKPGGGSETQAVRYKKDVWTADRARKDCQKQGGRFDKAGSSTKSMSLVEAFEEFVWLEPDSFEPMHKAQLFEVHSLLHENYMKAVTAEDDDVLATLIAVHSVVVDKMLELGIHPTISDELDKSLPAETLEEIAKLSSIDPEMDLTKLNTNALAGLHHKLHLAYRTHYAEGTHWSGFGELDDWVVFHSRLLKAMKENDIAHHEADELDAQVRQSGGVSLTTFFTKTLAGALGLRAED